MKPQNFYQLIYSVLGDFTPLKGDCGAACNKACCIGDVDGDGMYLFPKEEVLYSSLPSSDWFCISETDFEYSKNKFAPLFACNGTCDRNFRPLSCRIFPLTPYITQDGKLTVIVDPRSRGMCPLSGLTIADFDKPFVTAVKNVGKLLVKNSETRAFLTAFSRMLDTIDFL